MTPVYALCAVPALLALGILAARAVSAARHAVRRFRAASDDTLAEVPHRCPVCVDLAADEANGILRTDFELWTQELESTP